MDTGYLSQQVTTIINQLHGYFDEIGVASHERDTRESELFSALSETLHNQLKQVATEKHELTEEAQRIIKTIRQMEASLDDTKVQEDYSVEDAHLKVTYPLLECIQSLKEKHNGISKLHHERFQQVKKLAEALQSYASHIESSFLSIKLPPTSPNAKVPTTFDLSPTYVAALDTEFTRVYEEYNKRVANVQAMSEDMVMLWGELGTPQAQVDSQIVKYGRDAPEQLGLHQEDLLRLKAKRDKLVEEKRGRERRLKELKSTIENLWNKLGIEESDRKAFLTSNRGCGLRSINEFEEELTRLEEMKRQNLHLFVEDARFKLQELWDGLYFSEEEMLEFTPAFSDVYSDALLSAHEAEIARLEALKGQRAPTLAMIDKHRSLMKDRDDLAASSQDASRLMLRGQKGEKRDPTRLLREEKMRKRIAKDLPKVEAELRKVLENWEDEYGRPFLVHGQRYLEDMEAPTQKAAVKTTHMAAPKAAPKTTHMTVPLAMPARSKTPSNPPPSTIKSAKTAPPASRNATLRGAPPARSKTPTATHRNPLASSVMAPSSIASTNFSASVSTFSQSVRSPSRIPGRAPLTNMTHTNNSPERQSRPGIMGQREDLSSTLRGRMAPPRVPPPKIKDFFAQAPPTPKTTPICVDSDRSASIVRHIEPEDVYDDARTPRSVQSFSTASTTSRPNSVLHNSHSFQPMASHTKLPTPHRYNYPSAPPPAGASRATSNTSNTSSIRSVQSAAAGSENWETYTDASDAEEPDARDAYYAKVRSAKRLTPDDEDEPPQSAMKKKVRGYGLGINGAGPGVRSAVVEPGAHGVGGSEAEWTDDGSIF